jgi:hypothetical protein
MIDLDGAFSIGLDVGKISLGEKEGDGVNNKEVRRNGGRRSERGMRLRGNVSG